MMTSIANVTNAVTAHPGKTAYWHNVHSGRPVRQNWCYEAFARATKAGKIIRFPHKAQTLYFPAGWSEEQIKLYLP